IINGSAKDLHELFFKTYNTYYSSNSEMFANLYNTLRLYLRGDNINLVKVFDKFFMELVKKLFTLTNASYKFDDKYLECAGKQITSVQNFSQNTYSIFNLIKRSIVTTRVFIQALNVGKEVLALLSQLEVPATCAETFTRMSTCSYCAGLLNVRPCHQYCLNVMATCYAPYYAMHDNWVTFIG
ncbi:hypothetical protein HELRODRAFT_76288, partial [Helobdella robusta]|uniref:Glypican-1 n=1 Tax=Helobdella robusta TaxID=6412 RepID=T1G2H9_HELRO